MPTRDRRYLARPFSDSTRGFIDVRNRWSGGERAVVLPGSVSTQRHFIANVFDASPCKVGWNTRTSRYVGNDRKWQNAPQIAEDNQSAPARCLASRISRASKLQHANCNKWGNRVVEYFRQRGRETTVRTNINSRGRLCRSPDGFWNFFRREFATGNSDGIAVKVRVYHRKIITGAEALSSRKTCSIRSNDVRTMRSCLQ